MPKVSPDGGIYLNETSVPLPYQYLFLEEWPNDNYPQSPDPPFIAPFYSDAAFDQLDSAQITQLSYRLLDITDVSLPANQQVRAKNVNKQNGVEIDFLKYMHSLYIKH